MSYVFHPAAEAEHLESVAWYESKRAELGARYLAEFDRLMARVCTAPHRHPVERAPNVRRVRMKQFPYTVLYRESAGAVQVLAVAHHRRHPEYWLGRI